MPSANKHISRLLIYLAVLAVPLQGFPAETCGCVGCHFFGNSLFGNSLFGNSLFGNSVSSRCCCATVRDEGGCCSNSKSRQQDNSSSCCGKTKGEKSKGEKSKGGKSKGRKASPCKCGSNCQCGKSHSPPPLATPTTDTYDVEQLIHKNQSTVATTSVPDFPSLTADVASRWQPLPATALERCTSLCRFTL